MANQILPDDHNASGWFRIKQAAGGIAIIIIHHEQKSFKKLIIPYTDEPHSSADRNFWVLDFCRHTFQTYYLKQDLSGTSRSIDSSCHALALRGEKRGTQRLHVHTLFIIPLTFSNSMSSHFGNSPLNLHSLSPQMHNYRLFSTL